MTIKVLQFVNTLDVGGATEIALLINESISRKSFTPYFASGPGIEWHSWATSVSRDVFIIKNFLSTYSLTPKTVSSDLKAVFHLARILRENKIDILHCHGSKSRFLGGLAGYLAGTPICIQTAHGYSFHPFQSPLKRFTLQTAERFTGRFFNQLITVSQFDFIEAHALKLGRENQIKKIYYGIHTDKFASALNKKSIRQRLDLPLTRPIVLMVGRLAPQKNPLMFVHVAKKVLQKIPEALFLLAGDGPLEPEVRKLVGGQSSHIQVLGQRHDVSDLLKACDLFILTSKWEGLPIAILEALSSQTPVVATDIDGTPEVVINGETGYCLPVDDILGFSKHIIKLIQQAELRRVMGENGRKLIESRHKISQMLQQYEKLYMQLKQDT